MKRRTIISEYVGPVALAVVLASPGISPAADGQRIEFHIGDKMVNATLNDSPEAREFATMLPLSLQMSDLLGREKIAELPEPLTDQTKGVMTYLPGDLGYWRPSGDFVIYYAVVSRLPAPGIVPLGKIDGSPEAFHVPGDVKVTINLAK